MYYKPVLLIKCGSGCICNSTVVFWCVYPICIHCHILSTTQVLSYNDPQFSAILIILIFYNFSKQY